MVRFSLKLAKLLISVNKKIILFITDDHECVRGHGRVLFFINREIEMESKTDSKY